MKRSRNFSASGTMVTADSTAVAMLDPLKYTGGLPYEGGYALCTKNCSAAATISATSYPEATLLWAPKRGYDSLWMMTKQTGNQAFVVDLGITTANLVLNKDALWLPTYDSAFNINVEPVLESTFAISRVAAASLCVESSTTSTTSAALSGVISAAAINDLRDLKQPGLPLGSFSTAAMAQVATTIKDAVINAPAQEGVVAFLGPDVASELKPTEYNMSPNYGHSAVETFDVAQVAGVGRVAVFMNPGVYVSGASTSQELSATPGWLSRIVSFDFNTPAANKLCAVAVVWGRWLNGVFDTVVDRQGMVVMNTTGYAPTNFTKRYDPPSKDYFFVGIVMELDQGCGGVLKVIHVDAYDQSTLGALRLIRWENIASGQNVSVKASITIEGVATGAIAPYVKPTAVYSDSTFNLPLIRSMFNDPTNGTIKRVYNRREAQMLAVSGMVTEATIDARDHVYKASGMFGQGGALIGSLIGGSDGARLGHTLGSLADIANPMSWLSSGGFRRGNASGMIGSAAGMIGYDGV